MNRIVGAAVLIAAIVTITAPDVAAAPSAAGPPSRLVPVGPIRLADTRAVVCGCTVVGASTVRVQVQRRDVTPLRITAAVITVTATDAAVDAFVTVWPTGTVRPDTSMLNVRPGFAVANSMVMPVGENGSIELFASADVELIVDISAAFVASTSAREGRFVPSSTSRLIDTRSTAPLGIGGSIEVPLPSSVPADAVALAINVTSVDAKVAGYLTARPADTAASTSSFMNPDGSGSALAASIIVPTTSPGIVIEASSGGHIIVDLVGWFTGPSAPDSTDGLFVPSTPTRILDTRTEGPRLWPRGTREIATSIPTAAAVVTNVTLDRSDAAGFVTAHPAGQRRPATSSVNAAARNSTVANLAITTLSDRGLAYYSNAGTDLIVDLTGWFTGTPLVASEPPSANVAPALRVLLIGDSTLAALDVTTGSQRALSGFAPVLDAAPCRRLLRPSCRSAFTGLIPDTAVEAIARTAGRIDAVVIKAGYNEGSSGFDVAVTAVVLAARARGSDTVVWLTYSEGTGSQLRTYEINNAAVRRLVASGEYPELVIADWRTYASSSTGWYAGDRVHLQGAGAWATADYMSRWVAHVTHRPCPVPWTPGGALDERCPNPDLTAAAIGTPDLRELYGF